MLKKLLIGSFLFFLSFQALHAFKLTPTEWGTKYLQIDLSFKNERQTDWIGVYVKGSSVDWKNVIEWKWVSDLDYDNTKYYVEGLDEGDYIVRYFKDNSFTVSDEYELDIANEESKMFYKVHEYLNGNASLRLRSADKEGDWIGYYKKGTSTAWKNVIKWHWVKDLACSAPADCHDTLPLEDLTLGEYEVRYFRNNSYIIHGEPLSLNIKKVNSTLESISARENSKYKGTINMHFSGLGESLQSANSKDWIGLYEAHDSNAWENVVKWVWAKDLDLRASTASHTMKDIERGRYEVRYFLNNSFSIYAKSKPFYVK